VQSACCDQQREEIIACSPGHSSDTIELTIRKKKTLSYYIILVPSGISYVATGPRTAMLLEIKNNHQKTKYSWV
jgi:hypothetical protein